MSFDHLFVFQVPLPALDDLRMQKKVMWHNHCTQDTHDDDDRPFRDRGLYPADACTYPVNVDQRQFIKERETNDRNKGDDKFFHPCIGIGKEQDHYKEKGEYCTGWNGYVKQHVQCHRGPKDLREGRGNGSCHGRRQQHPGCPPGSIFCGCFCQAKTRGNSKVGNIVLQDDQHNGGERDHP